MLLMVRIPKDLVSAIEACRKGAETTASGLKKGQVGEFVVVEYPKRKKNRFGEFAARGNEVLSVFEGNEPWGVVINGAVFKYIANATTNKIVESESESDEVEDTLLEMKKNNSKSEAKIDNDKVVVQENVDEPATDKQIQYLRFLAALAAIELKKENADEVLKELGLGNGKISKKDASKAIDKLKEVLSDGK